jgi:NADH-quinone oxidoreductase subunit M
MFNSVFNYSIVLGAVACISIILAAVYTLWMVQKVFYGEVANEDRVVLNVPINTQLMLAVLVAVVLFFGIYPQPMINLTSETVTKIIAQIK